MKRKYLILSYIFAHSLAFGQITFSEIMFDVATDENHDEFVELYNLSGTDSIDITGWQFSDSSGIDMILPYRNGTKIPPHSFAVILDGSYFLNSSSYDKIIPASVILLTIDNNTFGSGGLSNSTAELLSLTDAAGHVLASYRYSTGNKPGYSDEKVVLAGTNGADNWQDSRVPGGTPGFHNSVSPWPVDLGLQEGSIKIPDLLVEGDSITVEIEIYDLGLEPVEDTIVVCLFIDQNENNRHDAADRQISEKVLFYSSVRTSSIQIGWNNLPAGQQRLGLEINYPADENQGNNLWFRDIVVLMHQNVLHINEIKFLTFDGESEWLEIINTGTNPISLKGWSFADLQDTIEIDSLVYLYPQQLKVMSAGSVLTRYNVADSLVIVLPKFLNLNNDEDDLTLLEPGGRWLERMHYEADWLQDEDLRRQVSLERINPLLAENKQENWGPAVAVEGATPAAINSIYSPVKRGRQQIMVSPNPFSPDGDGYQDVAIISGEIPENSARIRVQIFDLKGRLIRTLQENRFSGRYFNLAWDGQDGSGRLARIGIYIIFMQVLNERAGVLREMKSTVVLAQKL
jgi:hypothetical protein